MAASGDDWNDPPQLQSENWVGGQYISPDLFPPYARGALPVFAVGIVASVLLMSYLPTDTLRGRLGIAYAGAVLNFLLFWWVIRAPRGDGHLAALARRVAGPGPHFPELQGWAWVGLLGFATLSLLLFVLPVPPLVARASVATGGAMTAYLAMWLAVARTNRGTPPAAGSET